MDEAGLYLAEPADFADVLDFEGLMFSQIFADFADWQYPGIGIVQPNAMRFLCVLNKAW